MNGCFMLPSPYEGFVVSVPQLSAHARKAPRIIPCEAPLPSRTDRLRANAPVERVVVTARVMRSALIRLADALTLRRIPPLRL